MRTIIKLGKERWHKTFLGARQQHTYWLYKVIDDILAVNPQIERFVELGTGNGALSVILGLHSVLRGTKLLTIDKQRREGIKSLAPVFQKLKVMFINGNYLDVGTVSTIEKYIGNKPCFMFCDGAKELKSNDFNFFGPRLPCKSIICAHDYPEIARPEDMSETIKKLNLIPLFEEEWVGGIDDIQTCFFLKP
jgi:hypothetical protein